MQTEDEMWRKFGLRRALANMPRRSPGRAVVEALLARGSLTEEEGQRIKVRSLRNALDHLPPDEPGRAVVETLLAREIARQAADALSEVDDNTTRAAEPAEQPAARTDILDQLERLASLRERGYLSDDEFIAAKRKLLT